MNNEVKRDILADKYWIREINNVLENCLGFASTKLTREQKEMVVDEIIFNDYIWELIFDYIKECIEEVKQ